MENINNKKSSISNPSIFCQRSQGLGKTYEQNYFTIKHVKPVKTCMAIKAQMSNVYIDLDPNQESLYRLNQP